MSDDTDDDTTDERATPDQPEPRRLRFRGGQVKVNSMKPPTADRPADPPPPASSGKP
jgi:hypothetical protein